MAHQPDPARASEGVEAQRHKPQRDDAQQHAAEGLVQQEYERASEALDLARVVTLAGLDEEPTDDQKGDAAGEHAESAECDRALPFGLAHLRALQILCEGGSIGLEKLPDADPDSDEAEADCQPAAAGMVEDGGYRFLGAVAGRSG